MTARRRRVVTVLAVPLTLAVLAAGCGGDDEDGDQLAQPSATASSDDSRGSGGKATVAGREVNFNGALDVRGKDEVELEADDYYFSPTVLRGTPGQTVTLEIHNEGGVEHNFRVHDQAINKDIEAGEDITITVTIPQSGELPFICEYHVDQGMAGGLAVFADSKGTATDDSGSSDAPDGYRNY